MARILVVGGAGYIGSHMAKALARAGFAVTVFDNLSTGHREAARYGPFVQDDLRNPDDLQRLFGKMQFDAVMHFAACCYVGESIREPGKYYENNVAGTINLLQAMRKAQVRQLVFSSTCATYGDPVSPLIDETHPQRPINPYGMSKLMAERVIADFGRAHRIQTVALRYFNSVGCDPEGELGERHDPETHLVPLVLAEALRLRAGGTPADTRLEVYGDDFDTPDGTCIRDYVHVSDICAAHLSAMGRLASGSVQGFEAFNLGTGRGYSVKEVIQCCREQTGQDILYKLVQRREGDPSRLVASAELARRVLGWTPAYQHLPAVVHTAYEWLARQAGASIS